MISFSIGAGNVTSGSEQATAAANVATSAARSRNRAGTARMNGSSWANAFTVEASRKRRSRAETPAMCGAFARRCVSCAPNVHESCKQLTSLLHYGLLRGPFADRALSEVKVRYLSPFCVE